MAARKQADVAKLIAFLEENRTRRGDVTLNDVMLLAQVMTGSMREVLGSVKPAVTEELMAIGEEISRMKGEISQLRAVDIKDNRIPEAGRELDAIVEATESATHTIMEAAETIMSADASDIDAYQATVNDKIVEIFEACAFQDITGQRISKVVNTLNYIDERVSAFMKRLRVADEDDEGDREETEAERRQRELILYGPQHAGEGVSQDQVDAMLGDDAQAEIDRLFG
ncbi:protein phosphatase CheZ [Stappia sp. F7233]|uniref:Protein phosphatase CheZ n=1 Tax=Stappia albiluteola TaxID=2758565 RepID=A0A839AJB5_9HYPH|nr:protein phosphatase CheZ [Stappia albiluteola]MBA5779002.1 protein phosphatase CheZ [Stappia albiluteola]